MAICTNYFHAVFIAHDSDQARKLTTPAASPVPSALALCRSRRNDRREILRSACRGSGNGGKGGCSTAESSGKCCPHESGNHRSQKGLRARVPAQLLLRLSLQRKNSSSVPCVDLTGRARFCSFFFIASLSRSLSLTHSIVGTALLRRAAG